MCSETRSMDSQNIEEEDDEEAEQKQVSALAAQEEEEEVEAKRRIDDRQRRAWPEDDYLKNNNDHRFLFLYKIYQRWTYSYMTPLLAKGSRQERDGFRLTPDDLLLAPPSMESAFLVKKFQQNYHKDSSSSDSTPSSSQRRSAFWRQTLWKLAAPTFVPAGFFAFVTILCQVSIPLLVRQLLTILEEHPNENIMRQGLPYSIALFVVVLLNGLANHRHRHLAMKSGIVMRAALVNMLYRQVFVLSPAGRVGLSSGQVTTLVAVDTQKLFEVTQEGHLIWSLPLAIILVTILLVLIMGPVTLVGILVLIVFLPLASFITTKMLQIRKLRVVQTDQRIQITTAMLQGIQVCKLHNYEEHYLKWTMRVRQEELRLLKKELAVWAMTLTLTVLSPVVACAATFSLYVLIDPENNILTAAKTFTVLLLFSALRFPINYAGRLLGKAAQALSAVERIVSFLERETEEVQPAIEGSHDDDDDEDDDDNQPVNGQEKRSEAAAAAAAPLILEKAAFRIGVMMQDGGGGGGGASTSSTGLIDEEDNDDVASAVSLTRSAGRGGSYSSHNGGSSHGAPMSFSVSEFNLTVQKGQVVAVCGPVGAGKSTLIAGIIKQASPVTNETKICTRGKVAYVSQTPFILNATFRENILFGLPFDKQVYEQVLDACSLRTDIEQLGDAKDLTEIGERGVTLSGGQKQRVSLARAAYSRPDLVLLDDPLSALDAGTSKLVFENLIKGPNAYFSDTAVVLVTHAAHFLNRVDRILLIVGGCNKFQGTWNELANFHPDDDVSTLLAVDSIRLSVQEGASDEKSIEQSKARGKEPRDKRTNKPDEKQETRALVQAESREHGLSSVATWLLWFHQAGGLYFIALTIIFLAFDRSAYVAVEYWLAKWTDGAYESIEAFGIYFPPQTEGLSAQFQYLTVYSLLLLVSCIATSIRSEWVVTGGSRAARKVFGVMLASVLRAPLSYFETQPQGRILSRFTYDTEVVDILLTENLAMFMIALGWFFAGIVLMATILPWMLLALVPVSFLYWLLLLHYRKSGVDFQRLDALSRSPIQAMVTEVLDGSSTIRVFKREPIFVARFQEKVDRNSSAMLNFVSAQRWLGVRIELLGSIVVLASCVLVVCMNESLSLEPGIVGLLIVWSSNFTLSLGFLIDFFGEAEAAITAIERIDAMARLPTEKPMETDPKYRPPASWPEEGAIEFSEVCLRYREGLPLALKNLSFKIPPGKSCGIVGRTGAGKSSLSVALFRIVEIESGRILLDGRDLGLLGLSDVRGRPKGMFIIPQDPFLAGSTLRECLDPFEKRSDEDVLEALRSVRMARADDTAVVLDSVVEEGGSNYSVGERQLINVGKALLSQPKVLVLDEATAATDGETDAFIQRMLRTRFRDTTLFTVAHRLHTIMDYDLVLVMDDGHAVELGSPAELLENTDGTFSELVNATGPESAKALRAMAHGESTHSIE